VDGRACYARLQYQNRTKRECTRHVAVLREIFVGEIHAAHGVIGRESSNGLVTEGQAEPFRRGRGAALGSGTKDVSAGETDRASNAIAVFAQTVESCVTLR